MSFLIYHLLCRFFWLVGVQDIDRSIPYEARTIHAGTRELHSIQTKSFQNVFAFDSRKQSCFCHILHWKCWIYRSLWKHNEQLRKHWKHTKINPKGKMPPANIEELESEEIKISSDGNTISNLVREGNDVVDCSILSITLCLYSQINANCNLHRRYFRCDCTFRQQRRRKILFDVMHWRKNEVIGGLKW